ncbi:hypothetical protein RND71_043813 [Anisodus tanguticus]|uniref:Uncharacterized protein n=1 Tax=Anisodus tanguticus TaxID=243964 RepID=A0AAE1QQI2_9SOLA|nr:hypothetical protein RND71_043813 [Anisodus tanguticus]
MDNDRQTKDLRSPCVLALRTGIAEFESAGSDEWLLASFALQGREGIRAGRKRRRSSYGHKEYRDKFGMLAERRLVCSGSHRLAKAKNGTTLLTDYIRSEILNFKYNASWNGVALATVVYICQESHHSRSRSSEDKPTYLGEGPDLDVERSFKQLDYKERRSSHLLDYKQGKERKAEAEKKAYDSVGVK